MKQQNLEQLEGFKSEAAKTEAELTQKKPEIVVLRQETTTLKTQLAALQTQVCNFQRTFGSSWTSQKSKRVKPPT